MKSKSSSSKKKGPFIPYTPPPHDTPSQEVSWYDKIPDVFNDPTASSWRADTVEDSSMTVNFQSTTKIAETSKLSSKTINNVPFL